MRRRSHFPTISLLTITLIASACLAQSPPRLIAANEQPALLDEVLSWLPEDTEAVMGASGVFPLTDPNGSSDPQPRPYVTELTLRVQSLPLSLLLFKNGGLSESIQGKPVVLALEGSRKFRAPAGKGPMRFEGSEIVVFGEGVSLDWDAFRHKAAPSVIRFEKLVDTEVAVFEEQSGADKWTTYVAFPRRDVLLLATDRSYLQTVLSRMQTPATSRALSDTLQEWTYVNTNATAWGLRHYRQVQSELDSTSPFHSKAAENVPDPDAVGVTFWYDPEQQKVVTSYISINPDAGEIASKQLRLYMPSAMGVHVDELAPAVVQATGSLLDLDHFYNLMFAVMALMGHAVYM